MLSHHATTAATTGARGRCAATVGGSCLAFEFNQFGSAVGIVVDLELVDMFTGRFWFECDLDRA